MEAVDTIGLAHAIMGVAALVFGLIVVLSAKGTASHRLWGSFYVVAMVLLNASALAIYDLTGTLNAFHVFAILSLVTVAAGWIPSLLRRPGRQWQLQHAMNMTWSYVGLVAAFAAEIVTRLPPFRSGRTFGIAVGAATLAVIAAGGLLVRRHVPREVSRLGARLPSEPVRNVSDLSKRSPNDV